MTIAMQSSASPRKPSDSSWKDQTMGTVSRGADLFAETLSEHQPCARVTDVCYSPAAIWDCMWSEPPSRVDVAPKPFGNGISYGSKP